MSQQRALKSLEQVLEAFLDRVVAYKQPRLRVLDGINRLDEIARTPAHTSDITDRIGDWFASNNPLLAEDSLRTADITRISQILGEIKSRLDLTADAPPSVRKISSEIDRWRTGVGEKITMHRGPELTQKSAPPQKSAPAISMPAPAPDESDSIARFDHFLKHAMDLYADYSGRKKHLISVLDDLLIAAERRQNKDALILSAFIIYYLRLGNYKVEPFVRRLKKAEESLKGGTGDVEPR